MDNSLSCICRYGACAELISSSRTKGRTHINSDLWLCACTRALMKSSAACIHSGHSEVYYVQVSTHYI